MKVLHLDTNHELLASGLEALGCENHFNYTDSKDVIEKIVHEFDGLIIRSRFVIDENFLSKATHLKFIGRVGAGLENIDVDFAKKNNIQLLNAPEGNRNAVGEHALGMLLSLFNKLNKGHNEICNGKWDREGNRGLEIEGKTIGVIGYGNMGKAFSKKLIGFDCEVLCYDIVGGVGDDNARQVGILEFQKKVDVVSLHTPQTPETMGMINTDFINEFQKPFWFINTARGKSVVTADLVAALKSRKILGAGLDVLEYEKSSFENMFDGGNLPDAFQYLMDVNNVILSPHVAGWTVESKEKLAQTIVAKVAANFFNSES
ncbi:2-hydroxyacid dehydrogenase [Spongiivirga citrea]|uniref:Hydroxyacid dehydrogenase n=1 Tax=Spongiivirga citrea TaxID=1481457 RepID=A0A6M0CJD7_9FLAO|nr:2-hydroxyacid dehydrogenase [Spongiivirga citrea]NER18045.1 hydroxyacid dehydrogenase [Spongiivirga citrea]